MTQPTTLARPQRADAQRNHDRVLAAARAGVAEHGRDVVLEEVARAAGVGIGTLYRHFPTRQALLEAAFVDEATDLRRRAEDLASTPETLTALTSWLKLQLAFGAHGRALGAAVMNAKHVEGSPIQLACRSMRDAGAVLLEQAQTAGEIRPGVQMTDVLRLIHGIVLVNEQCQDDVQAARMFELVIAGIRMSTANHSVA